MAAEQIERTRWAPFLDKFTKSLIGKRAISLGRRA